MTPVLARESCRDIARHFVSRGISTLFFAFDTPYLMDYFPVFRICSALAQANGACEGISAAGLSHWGPSCEAEASGIHADC